MGIDLSEIGMERGMLYETVITTSDSSDNMNASPFGVICGGKDSVMCRIFKGGKTLDNIIKTGEFTVNISENPLLFTFSIFNKLDEIEFGEDNSIKNIDAYFKCEVSDLIEAIKQSDPIRSNSQAIVIKANVCKLVINNPVKAYNRSLSLIIESLVHCSRLDLLDSDQKEYSISRIKEASRVVKKVGSKKDKKAMDLIKSELINKGYDL